MCPQLCSCVTKSLATVVACTTGNLDDRSFAKIMSSMIDDVQILKIIAPKNRPNRLTITQDFERFRSLTELHLINCRLRSLGKRTFENMKNLRILNVADNEIDVLSPDTFTNTEHLRVLNLSRNRLNRNALPTGTFAHLRRLENLDLSENYIENFSTTNLFAGLNELRILILDKNFMGGVGDGKNSKSFDVLLDLPNLESLSLSECQIADVPSSAFRRNPLLKRLTLSKNKLRTSFVSATKNVPNLEYLDLSSNLIRNMADSTFNHVRNLKVLILANNFIGSSMNDDDGVDSDGVIDENGRHFNVSLEELDLSNNGIVRFKSSSIKNLAHTLKILRLSSNNLTNITSEQTKSMKNLKRLYLSDVRLTFLPDSLPIEYENLRHLDISNNEISSIDVDQTSHFRSLTSLDVSKNNFTQLTDNQLIFFGKLNRFVFIDNPWDCQNCRTVINLKILLKNRQKFSTDDIVEDGVRCTKPNEMYQKSVRSIEADQCSKYFGAIAELSPKSEIGFMIAGLCALTLILILTTVVVCCYFYNRHVNSNSSSPENHHRYHRSKDSSPTKNIEETATLSSTSSDDNSQRIQPSIRDLAKFR